jgi:23S rRNA pseudouridine2604 synthase
MLSEKGFCSRTKAESWVLNKWIKCNGRVLEKPEHKVEKNDFILLDFKALEDLEQQLTIILNKPPGYVSGFDDPNYKNALTLLTERNFYGSDFKNVDLTKMGVVGRLDADSRGLLIFTQDGQFAKSIIGESSEVEKEYLVKVKGNITQEKIKRLRFGLSLDGKKLKEAKVELISDKNLRFILTEGKNRQIRRMCGAVDLEVVDLKRIRIGHILLSKNLNEGQWTFLNR